MRNCERCGKNMPDTASICPSCGTSYAGMNPPSSYTSGPYPTSEYAQGYSSQPIYQQPQAGYPSSQNYQAQQPNYSQNYNAQPPMYQSVAVNVNVNGGTPPAINSTPIIVEVLLNIFTGIYGIGWLMSGQTTVGVVLLICSLVFYWPIMIVGTILTLGLGLACLGPLAIGAIIVNAILLRNAIQRRAATYVVVQQPMPPRWN